MAQPSKSDLQTLDYAYLGAPFADVEAKSLSTATLDYAYLGAPFIGIAPAATGAYSLAADKGTFSLTGNAVGLLVGRKLTAATRAFYVNGIDANLIYTSVSQGKNLYYQTVITNQKKTLISNFSAEHQLVYYVNNIFRIF